MSQSEPKKMQTGIVDRIEGGVGYVIIDAATPFRIEMPTQLLAKARANREGAPVRLTVEDGEVVQIEYDEEAPSGWLQRWMEVWKEEHGEPYKPKRHEDYEPVPKIDPQKM